MRGLKVGKAARSRDAGGDLPKIERFGGLLANENTSPIGSLQGHKVVLAREVIRDGARRGEPSAKVVATLITPEGRERVLWMGFSAAAAREIAEPYRRAGAELADTIGGAK